MYRLFLIAALVACGHTPPPRNPGEVYVEPIQVDGNHAISTSDLVGGLALSRNVDTNRGVDPFQLSNDTERIKGAFLRLGFFIVQVQAEERPGHGTITVIFHVVEGPRAKLVTATFPGLPADIPEAQARALLKLADGAPFDYDPYDDAKDTLLRLLQDSGYAHAKLEGNVIADKVNNQATVEYLIDAGPHCQFGETTIYGIGEGALAGAIRARQAFHKGEAYSLSAVEKTQRALYGVGRFSTVRVQPDLGKDGANTVIPVSVVVTEANRHELRAGGGFGLDPVNYSARLRAQYTQNGVFDELTTFSAEARPALTYQRDTGATNGLFKLIGRLTRNDLGRPDLKGEVEGGLDYATVEAYTQTGFRARAGLSSPIGTDKLQARIGWTFALYGFTGINAAIQPPTPMGATCVASVDAMRLGLLNADCSTQTERLGAFTQAVALDLRDSPIEPHRGFYASMQVAEGTRYAGGDFSYIKLEPELRVYIPLGPLVLAGRVHLATIDGDVPVTERLYGGGASSDRGFDERRLSPVSVKAIGMPAVVESVVVGGAALVEAGFEVRIPLGELYGVPFGIVGFVDSGDVRESPSDLDFANLHVAAGGGLRIQTPIGPLRADFAYRLNRFGPDEPQAGDRFHYFVSVGEAF